MTNCDSGLTRVKLSKLAPGLPASNREVGALYGGTGKVIRSTVIGHNSVGFRQWETFGCRILPDVIVRSCLEFTSGPLPRWLNRSNFKITSREHVT